MVVPAWLLVVLVVGTVARFTRLVTKDTILDPVRRRIERKVKREASPAVWRKVDDFLVCPWCVSVWVSIPVAYVAVWFPTNRFILGGLIACTASWLAANVQVREPDDEPVPLAVVADVTVHSDDSPP